MKEKFYFIIPIVFVILTGIIGISLLMKETTTTITLDINPSIEIKLTNDLTVKNIKALNKDANEIIKINYKDQNLHQVFDEIVTKLIDKGYLEDDTLTIVFSSKGTLDPYAVADELKKEAGKFEIYIDVVVVEKITAEDEKLAKKYNITPAKAAYLNSIVDKTESASIDGLLTKSTRELREIENTGIYCNDGYIEAGGSCLKIVKTESPVEGEVCPRGYYEYQGVCYDNKPIEDGNELVCPYDYKLEGTKCIRKNYIDAEPAKYTCEQGEAKTRLKAGLTFKEAGDANDIVCVDYSNATHPVSPCELPADDETERLSANGTCYWHRAPVIESGCPGKVQVGDMCWDDASNILICAGYRDGKQYSSRNEYCENSIRYFDPIISEYKCPDSKYELEGNKCVETDEIESMHIKVCPQGTVLVDNDRCIDKTQTENKQPGLKCEQQDAIFKNNTCYIVEFE